MPVKDYDRKMERELEKLENCQEVSEKNKELLKDFDRHLTFERLLEGSKDQIDQQTQNHRRE